MNADTANIIKVAAVVTATPRWVGALLAAEGFVMPDEWRVWWVPVSAILSAGMALVEGLAFSYVFNAWRVQKDKSANKLLWLAILSAVVFIVVLAPFIAAQVRETTLESVLGSGWPLWFWSSAVASSTIVIVASVGYAQKRKPETSRASASAESTQAARKATLACDICGATETKDGKPMTKQPQVAAHRRVHYQEIRQAESPASALEYMHTTYPLTVGGNGKAGLTIADVRKVRES